MSRRGIATLGGIFGLPLALYLISVAVNVALPCGPDFAAGAIYRSLVQIAVGGSAESIALAGTGFAVSGDGHVLTSRRLVVDPATGTPSPRILAKLPNGLVVKARFVGADESLDLAMVKIDSAEDLRPVKWGDFAACAVGQPLVAASFQPSGDGRFAGAPTFTQVAISSLRHLDSTDYVEHQAAVSPTISGGPLVTMCGEVVGVFAKSADMEPSPGTSLSLGSSAARARVREWMESP